MNDEAELLKKEADQLADSGQIEQALPLYEQALALTRQAQDRPAEGALLSSLGLAYAGLGDYPKAIEFDQQTLEIAKELGDQLELGKAYGNLGNAYWGQGDYPHAVESAVQASLIFMEIESPNLRIAFNQLTRVRRQVGQAQFEEWFNQVCQPLELDYPAFRARLEQAQVFSDIASLNPTLKQMAYTMAQAGLGVPEAVQIIQGWLSEARDKPEWAKLNQAAERIIAGERDRAVLMSDDNGLDITDKAIIELILEVIADPQKQADLLAELTTARQNGADGQGRLANGLSQMQQRLAQVLAEALRGNPLARKEIETDVLPLFEEEKSHYKALAAVMRRMFDGELDEAHLLDPANGLDEIDQTIVKLTLSLAGATTAPSALETLSEDDPLTETRYQNFLALLVAATRGESASRTTALELIAQMQQQPETQRLAATLERLIEAGGGDRADLTQGLDEEDAALVEAVLDELEAA